MIRSKFQRVIAALFASSVLFSSAVSAQTCPANSSPAVFSWSTSAGTGNEWSTADQTDGASRVYAVNYTDGAGDPQSVDVTVTLQDPDGMNFDDNFVCPTGTCDDTAIPVLTETNGNYGPGFLTVGMASTQVSDEVGFQFSFSRPGLLGDAFIGDVDDQGFGSGTPEPWQSYQDEMNLSASLSGSNVGLTLSGGSNITVLGQTANANYAVNTGGNLGPGDAAGTLEVTSNSEIDSFTLVYKNGQADADAEEANAGQTAPHGESDGHAIRISGFTFCVVDQPEFAIQKTSNTTGPVSPGDTITYTIEVENTGSATANDVVLSDVLPSGVTYVANSAEKTYPSMSTATGTCTQNAAALPQTFSSNVTQTISVSAGSCNGGGTMVAGATLTDVSYATTGSTNDWLSDLSVTLNDPSGFIDTSSGADFGGNGSGEWDIAEGPFARTGPAEGNYTLAWADSFVPFGGNTNTISTASVTLNWTATTTGSTTDAAGAPPSLVVAGDDIDLEPGESLVVTFDVTVDDPLAANQTSLTNTASATSTEITTPVEDSVTDTVVTVNLSGNVFNDLDGLSDSTVDGVGTDAGGLFATLIDSDGNVYASVPVAADGTYSFSGVVGNSDYSLQLNTTAQTVGAAPAAADLPDGWASTGENIGAGAGDDGSVDTTISGTVGTSDISDLNFGIAQPQPVSGSVWLDEDLDGINDIGEAGLTGIVVELVDSDGNVVATTTTDANGDYSFDEVFPGSYTVNVDDTSLPSGLTNTAGQFGLDPRPINVTDAPVEDVDFGYIPVTNTGAIGDRVWSDADGDGIQDPGEAGIEGVTVNLLDSSGAIIATTTTGADGDYLFTNVPYGEDYVVEVDSSDADITGFTPTSGPQSEGSYTSAPVTLNGAITTVSDVDFGFQSPDTLTIADTIWYDTNGDGSQQAGEPGIAGVTVDLVDSSGNVVATAVTDANGNFTFSGVPEGTDYVISVTDNAGILSGTTETTGTGGSETIAGSLDTASGADNLLSTVGDDGTPTFGYNNPGLISGTMWYYRNLGRRFG